MRIFKILLLAILSILLLNSCQKKGPQWTELFNGKDLSGWTANQHPESFKVENGLLVVNGPIGHLFYTGDIKKGVFRNFEIKALV